MIYLAGELTSWWWWCVVSRCNNGSVVFGMDVFLLLLLLLALAVWGDVVVVYVDEQDDDDDEFWRFEDWTISSCFWAIGKACTNGIRVDQFEYKYPISSFSSSTVVPTLLSFFCFEAEEEEGGQYCGNMDWIAIGSITGTIVEEKGARVILLDSGSSMAWKHGLHTGNNERHGFVSVQRKDEAAYINGATRMDGDGIRIQGQIWQRSERIIK